MPDYIPGVGIVGGGGGLEPRSVTGGGGGSNRHPHDRIAELEAECDRLRTEVGRLTAQRDAALVNCYAPRECIGWQVDQESGSQIQCNRCHNVRQLMRESPASGRQK